MKNKRRISYHRRDSRIGMLIGKSSNIKPSESKFEERKYNSQLTADNRLFTKALSGDQSCENARMPQRNQIMTPNDSMISAESSIISPKVTIQNYLALQLQNKDENLNKYVTEITNEVNTSDHSNNYKELTHELANILLSMNKWTELLNNIGSEGERIDPSLAELLSNVNMKSNNLQNAGFYALLKRSIS